MSQTTSPENKGGKAPGVGISLPSYYDFHHYLWKQHERLHFSGNAHAIWAMMIKCANDSQWTEFSFPLDNGSLQLSFRMGRASLEAARNELIEGGIITYEKRGGRGNQSIYSLVFPPTKKKIKGAESNTLSDAKKGAVSDTLSRKIKGVDSNTLFQVPEVPVNGIDNAINTVKGAVSDTFCTQLKGVDLSTFFTSVKGVVLNTLSDAKKGAVSDTLSPTAEANNAKKQPKPADFSNNLEIKGAVPDTLLNRHPYVQIFRPKIKGVEKTARIDTFYSLERATTAAFRPPNIEYTLEVDTIVSTSGSTREAKKKQGAGNGIGEPSKKVAAKKVSREEPFVFGQFMDVYAAWISRRTGGGVPQMDATQRLAGYDIIDYLRKSGINAAREKGQDLIPMLQDEFVLEHWQQLLDNSGCWDEWQQSRTKLTELRHQLQNLITKVHHELFRKTTQGTFSGQAANGRSYPNSARPAAGNRKGRGSINSVQGLRRNGGLNSVD